MDKKIDRADSAWPIIDSKDHKAPPVFRPEALLREARRQRQLPLVDVPEICVLDPTAMSFATLSGLAPAACMKDGPAIIPSFSHLISTVSVK